MFSLFGNFQHQSLHSLARRLTLSPGESQIIVEKLLHIFQPCQQYGYECQNVIEATDIHHRGISTSKTFLVPLIMTPPNFSPETANPTQFFTDLLTLLTPQVASITSSQSLLHVQLQDEEISYLLKPMVQYQNEFFLPQVNNQFLFRSNPFVWQERFKEVSQQQEHFFEALKLIKLWNQTKNQQALREDHLEAMLLHLCLPNQDSTIQFHLSIFDLCKRFFKYGSRYYYHCPDPSGLEEPLTDYLSDALQYWYVLMNRLNDAQEALVTSSQDFYTFLVTPRE